MIDPTPDPTGPDVAYDNTRPNTDPTNRTNDPTPDPTDADTLPIPAAAERLGLTSDAVRMRLKRGTLAGRKVNGRWVVMVPRSNADSTATEQRETGHATPTPRSTQRDGEQPNASRSGVQDDPRLIVALEERIASLERQLAVRDEEIRRRDHIMAGFIERLPELSAGGTSDRTTHDAIQRDDEAAAPPIPPWRQWLRRAIGGG